MCETSNEIPLEHGMPVWYRPCKECVCVHKCPCEECVTTYVVYDESVVTFMHVL